MKKILIILGPTAVGKSDMAIRLAQRFGGEIISADSVQVFKGLDIGSAKVRKEEMGGITHHLLDILPPQADFSVYEYIEKTKEKIDEILSRKNLPIIVGGTGLYIRALLGGYTFGGAGRQTEFREKMQQLDCQELYRKLAHVDPVRAEQISQRDKKRIIRGLEIAEFGEKPESNQVEFDALILNLAMEREKLYDRINLRSEKMIEEGLVEEVKNLLNQGVRKESQSMKAIGYKEVISFLEGEFDRNTMLELIKQHSRNYAKRQMTFFRSIKEAKTVAMDNPVEGLEIASEYVKEWLC